MLLDDTTETPTDKVAPPELLPLEGIILPTSSNSPHEAVLLSAKNRTPTGIVNAPDNRFLSTWTNRELFHHFQAVGEPELAAIINSNGFSGHDALHLTADKRARRDKDIFPRLNTYLAFREEINRIKVHHLNPPDSIAPLLTVSKETIQKDDKALQDRSKKEYQQQGQKQQQQEQKYKTLPVQPPDAPKRGRDSRKMKQKQGDSSGRDDEKHPHDEGETKEQMHARHKSNAQAIEIDEAAVNEHNSHAWELCADITQRLIVEGVTKPWIWRSGWPAQINSCNHKPPWSQSKMVWRNDWAQTVIVVSK